MKNKFNIIEAAMKYKQIVIFLTLVFVFYGVYSLFVMPRQEFPEFTIRQGVIVAVMPGATSEQMENQITVPIENYLFSFQEIDKKKTYSQSKEGVVYIFVELNESVTRPSEFWSKIKHGLNTLKGQLPSDLYGIFVNDDFGNTSAMLITLESETKSYKDLQDYMKRLEAQLRKIPAVSRLNRSGMQNEEINVYLQPEKLSYYGIKPMMIYMNFKTDASIGYAGDIKNENVEMPIHISSKYKTIEDISEQIIYSDPNGNVVRLKDIAEIKREQKEPDSYIENNRTKCLLLSIEMIPGNNIVQFGGEVQKVIDDYQKTLPAGVKISTIANQPKVVGHSITEFLTEFGIAILAVILVTMLLLPLRVATVAATTIPISILISIGILYAIGIELDTVSLAGLIIVLGMVVDNSIVIIDNHVEKLDHGLTPWEAAKESASELILPVFTATLAIFSTFFPLALFMTGTGKDFIQSFPVTIGVALGVSLLVAAFLVPFMSYILIKKGVKNVVSENVKKRKTILDIMQNTYDKTIEVAFRYPKFTILIAILSIIIGLGLMGVLPQELYPKMDRNQFAVEIYLPTGSTLQQTELVAKDVETRLLKDKRVTNVATFTGGSSPRFHTVYAPNMPSKNYAQMIVNTTTSKTTEEMLDEYSKKYTNYYPNAHVRYKQLDMQATKAPIEVRISGDSIPQIKHIADSIASMFRANKDVCWIRNDYEEARQSVLYDVNQTEANRLGVSKFDLTMFLTIAQKGVPIATLWEDDYPVDIKLNKQKSYLDKDFQMRDMYIPSLFKLGQTPLRSIATPRPEWTEGQIVRRNGIRTITVMIDVNRGILASKILTEEMPNIKKMNLPQGVSIDYGGEKEDEKKQYTTLSYALILGIFLIFLILLFQFKKIKTSILIMITMPLSVFGATFGLLIMGYPFGMTSFMGIIALCGIVVRNGIILIDYAVKLREEQHITILEAAKAAGKRRLRPIFLTSSAAAVGVIPMIVSKSLLWAPLASILSFGIMFSMIFTLFALPVLYWYFFRSEDNKVHNDNDNQELVEAVI